MTKPRPFGHYFILEKIAQGGMAEIFKGLTYDFSGLKKFVVIKRILPHIAANEEFIKMLIDEAKIAVSLTHGNIAQTFDLGKVGRDYFIVMEYVDGKTLSQLIKKAQSLVMPLPIPMVAYIISELCNGLDYIHRRMDDSGKPLGIVHRDISPQNIIVAYSGSIKVVDFGVAKAALKSNQQENGVLKGKFAYMSPEQSEGNLVDHRSDIFAAGVVMWEMLCLKRLYKRKNNAETIAAVKYQEFISTAQFRSDVPIDLDNILSKALSKDPEFRYQSAQEMSIDLTKFILKYYPDFKPQFIVEYLEKIFSGESEETTYYQEKTLVESVIKKSATKDLNQSSDETVIVDPQALDFKSLFNDIDLDDVSDHTQVINTDEFEHTVDIESIHEMVAEREDYSHTMLLKDDIVARVKKSKKSKLNFKRIIFSAFIFLILISILIARERILLKFTGTPAHHHQLLINSQPQGARVYLQDKPSEFITPVVLDGSSLQFPLKVGLYLDRYNYWENTLAKISVYPYQLDATLVQNIGRLSVSTLPLGAQVFLDEIFVGTTPLTLSEIATNRNIKLKVVLETYQTYQESIYLEANKNKNINVTLEKIK